MKLTFEHLFQYHFSENKRVLEIAKSLSNEQLHQEVKYSLGSIMNHLAHLVYVDDGWLSDIANLVPLLDHLKELGLEALMDFTLDIEKRMATFLSEQTDEDFFRKPITDGEDKDLYLWQILFHIINHGTDHRAQLHRLLYDQGVTTQSQDYVFHAYDNPVD
ncbi:MAG: DinB family protein [Candidatus Nanopelagicales bacterium]